MSAASERFRGAFGPPDPARPPGLRLKDELTQALWASLHPKIGAGWFQDGFLQLFCEGVEELQACLDAWSFLVPPGTERVILGRNAHGAILVLEHESEPGLESVHLLDPFTLSYAAVPNALFVSLIGRALPRRELTTFLDDSAYRDWMWHRGLHRLDPEHVLGVKVPRELGGTLTADNLQLEDIVDYYESTAPIYAEALATVRGER